MAKNVPYHGLNPLPKDFRRYVFPLTVILGSQFGILIESIIYLNFSILLGEVVSAGDPTTGIIVVAVVCCVLGTSLVWVIIIYHTRRRSNTQVGGGQIHR